MYDGLNGFKLMTTCIFGVDCVFKKQNSKKDWGYWLSQMDKFTDNS